MKRISFIILFITALTASHAQVTNTGMLDTAASVKLGNFSFGGYLDAYYAFDFNQPQTKDRPYFVSSARHNEFNINLAYINVQYSSDRLRMRITPGFGTYMAANYAAEPAMLRFLVEANGGVRIARNKQIWLDAGILGSPYTNESAISRDHLMYSRSFAPEYVPYYMTGVKLSLPLHEKLNLYLYVLNGWQQIQDNNKGKSFGTQLEYRPAKKHLINWNTFIGEESNNLDSTFRWRYFSDVYWIFDNQKKWMATSCVYAGIQNRANGNNDIWWQANLIGRYRFHEWFSLSARAEYFSDPEQVMIKPITGVNNTGIFSTGLCANVHVMDHGMIRVEGRYFTAANDIYLDKNQSPTAQSAMIILNLTAWF